MKAIDFASVQSPVQEAVSDGAFFGFFFSHPVVVVLERLV
jgi:hypothetical protein